MRSIVVTQLYQKAEENKKMTEPERERQEGLYEQLIKGSQDLTKRISTHRGTQGFDNFIVEHNSLLERYIQGFDSLNREQYERVSSILKHTKEYIHGTLDVYRAMAMRNVLIPKPKK